MSMSRALAGLALASVLLAGCGATPARQDMAARPASGLEARVSTEARDRIAKKLIAEYQGLSWNYESQAGRKMQLLETLAATGSDLVVDLLLAEYDGLSWNFESQAKRKQLCLDLLERMLSAAEKERRKPLTQSLKGSKAPSQQALRRAGKQLEQLAEEAPPAARKRLDGLVRRIAIISNNGSAE